MNRELVSTRHREGWNVHLKLGIEKWLLVIRPNLPPGWPDSGYAYSRVTENK